MTVAIELTSDRVLVALNDLIEIVGLDKIRLATVPEHLHTKKQTWSHSVSGLPGGI